jgi:hypothetical protein
MYSPIITVTQIDPGIDTHTMYAQQLVTLDARTNH